MCCHCHSLIWPPLRSTAVVALDSSFMPVARIEGGAQYTALVQRAKLEGVCYKFAISSGVYPKLVGD